MANWRDVHYVQRPAKNLERKLMVEGLGRLARYCSLAEFEYIGFGSVYFVDFTLFHRRLGVISMINMESATDADSKKRFRFNKPFECVKLLHGHSNELLPKHKWTRPSLIWLDYPYRLDESVIADIRTVVGKTRLPSVLIVSVTVEPGDPDGRLDRFRLDVGEERLPPGVNSDKDLAQWETARAAWWVGNNEITSGVRERNLLLDADKQVDYRQMFHFHYADNAQMLTFGGLLHLASDGAAVDDCQLGLSPFVRDGADAYSIIVPNLTIREMLHLERQLPTDNVAALDRQGIPPKDVDEFAQAYRHYPAFVDVEL